MLKKLMFTFSAIFLISLFVFYPSFNLALFGDDWLAFFRYAQHLGPESPGAWNHLTYYLTPYGPQDILMGLMQKIFGYQATPYFILSFIFRMIAAVSFYPLVFYLTKSRLASLFAVLFFSVTTIGLDTTNWVFNMPSYITVSLFNLFLYFFLKARDHKGILLILVSGLLYYLAYITTPIRMHGSLLFIFLLEAFWVIQKRSLNITKTAASRLSIILVVFLIVRFAGQSQGPSQEPMERFMIGLTQDIHLLSQGRFDFIMYPIVMFGSMLVPDFIGPQGQINALRQLLPLFIFTGLIFSIIAFFVIKNVGSFSSKFFINLLLALGLWIVLVTLIYKGNRNFFNNTNQIFSLLIGGYALILIGLLIIKFFKERSIAPALFLGASWSIISFFFAWWWVPTSIFPTIYRYLIVSAMGVSILLAVIVGLGKSRQQRIFLFGLFCSLIITHIIATRLYLTQLLNFHSQEISDKIWSAFPRIEEMGKTRQPLIFYFEGDDTNGTILHNVITFGFPPHMALLYNIREEDGGIPIPMSDPKELISAITDGKAAKAYGYPEESIPVDRIYGFKLQGKDNLINITDPLRKRLIEIKSNAQAGQ